MTDRLARIASRVARKKARGVSPSPWAITKDRAPDFDPWADIPEDQRSKVTERLPNGTLAETYVDTLDEFEFVPDDPEPEEPEPVEPAGDPERAAKATQWTFRGQTYD